MGCTAVPKDIQALLDKKDKTDGDKKKIKQWKKGLANPGKTADKLEKNEAKRNRRKESGSTKVINP